MTLEELIDLGDFGSASKNRDGTYTVVVSVDGNVFESNERSLDRALKDVVRSITVHVHERDRALDRLRMIAGKAPLLLPEPPSALPMPENDGER
ncbi:MAG: hypothetical protein M9921_13115 [Fimbriimonadaceae bacterium]|nr:hypothetical protein [Fimbriimonadaceae bacterium]